jgi:iron complex outermembrane receptor protein
MNAFRFKEFIEDTADYSGNQLTGVPESQFNFDWI